MTGEGKSSLTKTCGSSVESLDSEDLRKIEQLWVAEAKRRRHEVRDGTVKPISGEEGLRSVRDSLRWP